MPRPHTGQHLSQCGAMHKFHRVERPPVGIDAELMHRHNVWVLEHSGDARLVDKPAQAATALLPQHDLHRHFAPHGGLPRLVDRSHAAGTDNLSLPVVADARRQGIDGHVLPRAQQHITEARSFSLI